MYSEQMSERDVELGLVLRRLMEHEDYYPALQQIIKIIEDDAITQFCDDGSKGKKWLTGARDTAKAILPAIQARAEAATGALKEREEQREVTRSRGDDGTGSGDLAL